LPRHDYRGPFPVKPDQSDRYDGATAEEIWREVERNMARPVKVD
jgi:hypothetical protein